MNFDQLLTDAAHHVADRVDPPEVDLDAVRTRAHASRRRRTALAVTAAAVAAGLVGIPCLQTRDRTAPQPAAAEEPDHRTLPDADCAVGRASSPGRLGIPLGQDSGHRLRAKVTVQGGGWEADGSGTGSHGRTPRAPWSWACTSRTSSRVPSPATRDGATRKVAPDATMDDVVRLLTTLPQFAVVDGPRASRPSAVTRAT